ncbi:RmlC-like cupin domain-containing protein [Panaeolus papilionaceus]|nr:RmlC-like cupin domain-containing protein [Panaeolus papilionaceus]
MQFVPRKSEDRRHAEHGWLKTFHTFSFAMYQDHKHELFGPLRVINEDRVAAHRGFGTHSHREFEIFSYVVSGELEHKDSMGNTEILKRGALQLTSAGTGISHSEKIWSLPHTPRLTPKYYTRQFSDAEKKNKFVKVVAPVGEEGVNTEREGEGPAPVQKSGVKAEVKMGGLKGYVHLIQTSGYRVGAAQGAMVRVGQVKGANETVLREGDGTYVFVGERGNVLSVENDGEGVAEVVVFDLE